VLSSSAPVSSPRWAANARDRYSAIRNYRPDIDGLRAIAVVSVVGFHAFPKAFPGGFIGVDIFFVISGFLISGILFEQRERGSLSIAGFYARRIRRIFPALILVLATTLTIGWCVLFPQEFRSLQANILASAGFVSNIQLWNEAGYFDRAAASKPLLHLWSLGVEEQFYIVWPLLIMLVGRRKAPIALLAVASFAVNLWTVRQAPSAAFYLPMSRFWEMLAGALLASSVLNTSALRAWFGLGMIGAGAAFLNQDIPFPGAWALLPVVGAFLVISAGAEAWPNRVILSHRALVFIGLISYPLYLWHWPLLTFSRLIAQRAPVLAIRLVVVALSGLLAWLTYRFVERRGTPVILCGMLVIVAAGGIWIHQLPEPLAPLLATMRNGTGLEGLTKPACGIAPRARDDAAADVTYCESDARQTPVYAIFGDSHAGALYPALVRESGRDGRWMLIGRPGCAPISGDDDCGIATERALQTLVSNRDIKAVALAVSARMTGTLVPELSEGRVIPYAGNLSPAIERLEHAGKQVVVVVDNPSLPDPLDCIRRVRGFGILTNSACSIGRNEADADFARYRALISALRERTPRLQVFDPTDVLCPNRRCSVINHGVSFYSFSDHLSDAGGSIVARALLPFMSRR
jgi:peptidoglycan/LPS O-acetylase OafA/YrhL